jgi:hypothetical protein
MLLPAPEHVCIFDVVFHGSCLQLCCCGPWNMFTTMLSAGPGTRYIFDIAVLEPINNNNMITTMLFAGPGTCQQLCCLTQFGGPGTYLWRETIVCVCSVWRRREDNIDKQLLDSLFGHQPLIINHNNKYIIQSYPCCHLTG